MGKHLGVNDNFELLYLRQDYLKRAGQLDETLIKKYSNIVAITAKIMFNRLTNFEKVGFTEEDIVVITNVYMLSYMALYSIQRNPKELEKVLKKRKVEHLPEEEIQRIDRNNLINFLRQRLRYCGVLCAKKARNITVGIDRRGVFAETKTSQPVTKELILNDYEKYGYRKVKNKEYKNIVARTRLEGKKELTDVDGFKIIKIEILNEGINREDYRIFTESNTSFTYQQPDIILETLESERDLELKKEQFNTLPQKKRKIILSSFIRKNKNKESFRKEINLAKKILKKKTVMVL